MGITDCHDQFANWSRNDRGFTWGAVRYLVVRREGLSCPPSCQPTDGHCRTRQSGHFLRNRLASSATGGASPISPPAGGQRRPPLRITGKLVRRYYVPPGERRSPPCRCRAGVGPRERPAAADAEAIRKHGGKLGALGSRGRRFFHMDATPAAQRIFKTMGFNGALWILSAAVGRK